METLGDGPIQEDLRETMSELGRFLDSMLNGEEATERTWGFALTIFPFGTGEGRCNYLSNARREEVIVLLKEQLARFEGQPEASGTA